MAPSRALSMFGTARNLLYAPARLRTQSARSSARPAAHFPPSSNNTTTTNPRPFSSTCISRAPSLQAPTTLDESEGKIFHKLNAALEPDSLTVQDVSGGCGSMYALDIISPKFVGLSVIKQHKLVNQILADDIKGWHGVQLKTKAP